MALSFFIAGMSGSMNTGGHYAKGTPYDAFNDRIAAATIAGKMPAKT